MGIIIASQEAVLEYYNSEALGQSKAKLLLGNLADFNKEFDSSAEHFLLGSAIDCILTSTKEVFENTYYISKIEKKPSEAVIKILDYVYEDLLQDYSEHLEVVETEQEKTVTTFAEFVGELKQWSAYILDACKKAEWQPRWGDEAKLKNIIEGNEEYFTDLCNAFGKKVLSKPQVEIIKKVVNSLKSHPRTSGFFDREYAENAFNTDFYYQFPIYFEYRGVKCKALLDLVVVDKNALGEIISVTGVDLKTMSGNTYNFSDSIKKRRYDIQAAWYCLALQHYFNLLESPEVLKPFHFVVESTTSPGKPLNFQVDNSLLNIGRFGRKAISLHETDMFNGDIEASAIIQHEIKGFEHLLDLFIYHSENGFSEEREIQEAGLAPLKVSWDGIMS